MRGPSKFCSLCAHPDDTSSHDHLHHSDNDASLQPMLDAGSDLQISFHTVTQGEL